MRILSDPLTRQLEHLCVLMQDVRQNCAKLNKETSYSAQVSSSMSSGLRSDNEAARLKRTRLNLLASARLWWFQCIRLLWFRTHWAFLGRLPQNLECQRFSAPFGFDLGCSQFFLQSEFWSCEHLSSPGLLSMAFSSQIHGFRSFLFKAY